MRAWRIHKHGGSEQLSLETVERPIPGPNQARIRVQAIGLNHLDLWVRKGVPGHQFPLPITPGSDVSGVIESFGELSAEVKTHLERKGLVLDAGVIINPIMRLNPRLDLLGETRDGGCVEEIVVPVRNLILRPDQISPIAAASLPVAYVTAWSLLFRKAQIRAGEVILIQAGGSGVSIAAIQMAKIAGAHVITTVGSDEKARRAKLLGADFVINYKNLNFREETKNIVKRENLGGVDIVLDHVGASTFMDSLRTLKAGGRLVTCGATTGAEVKINLNLIFFKNLSIHGNTMGEMSDLEEVVRLVRLGDIKTVVDSTFGFDDLPKAHERLESREVFGKVVVTL